MGMAITWITAGWRIVHGQIGDNSVAVCDILRESLCELQTLRRGQLVR
jgi:hypothetical protein